MLAHGSNFHQKPFLPPSMTHMCTNRSWTQVRWMQICCLKTLTYGSSLLFWLLFLFTNTEQIPVADGYSYLLGDVVQRAWVGGGPATADSGTVTTGAGRRRGGGRPTGGGSDTAAVLGGGTGYINIHMPYYIHTHILNQHDPGTAQVLNSVALTVCLEVILWQKLQISNWKSLYFNHGIEADQRWKMKLK